MKVLLTGARGAFGTSFATSFRHQRPEDELIELGRSQIDLVDQRAVAELVAQVQPDAIVHAAAHVDGIGAQVKNPTGYLLDNVTMDANIFRAALGASVTEFLYVSSAAIYPAGLAQPLVESDLLTGRFEPENEGYALAKVSGTKLCELISREYGYHYRAVVPSNLYGVEVSRDSHTLHLIAAALLKVHTAVENGESSVTIWGDGTARREFTFMDDAARWLVSQVGQLEAWPVMLNLGSGTDHSINDFYQWAADIVGFTGDFEHDLSAPVGVHQRLLDSTRAKQLGWMPHTNIVEGMTQVYQAMFPKGAL